jgi:hypothetical protein
MRVMKLALAALFAVTAFSAMAASSASAWHPLFLTLSHRELSFTATGSNPVLRGENLGQVGTITCERVEGSGTILPLSPLAHRIHLRFFGKCEQTLNGNKVACNEPILPKLALGELGLLLLPGTPKPRDVVIKLVPDDGTGKFVTITCGANVTTVLGSIIGEIGPTDVEATKFTIRFESVGKNSVTQLYKDIDLLGVEMKNEHLSVEGFFGGEAAEDAEGTITTDGGSEICTRETSGCLR